MTRFMGNVCLFAAVVCLAAGQSPEGPTATEEIVRASMAELRGQRQDGIPMNFDAFAPSPNFRTFLFEPPKPARTTRGMIVSAARLRHQVPKEAEKLYKRANAAMQDGDAAKAMDHLLKAVAIDPDYAEAHCDLGVIYARGGHYLEAEVEFRTGLRLAPEASVLHSDLAWVLYMRGNATEARRLADQALILSSRNPGAHMVLGQLLVESPATRKEGIEHLEIAAKSIPSAKKMLKEVRGR